MALRLKNRHTGRVVEYATPEEIAPPDKRYFGKQEKAEAEREAQRRKRLLDTLAKSKRWQGTQEPVTRTTEAQREHARREAERARIEGELRAEFQRDFQTELAKAREEMRASHTGGDPAAEAEGKQPTQAELRSWAREQGYEVPSRGRIPDHVTEAYRAAHTEDA